MHADFGRRSDQYTAIEGQHTGSCAVCVTLRREIRDRQNMLNAIRWDNEDRKSVRAFAVFCEIEVGRLQNELDAHRELASNARRRCTTRVFRFEFVFVECFSAEY